MCKKIEQLLYDHEEVDKELIIVRFNEFSDSSLDIYIYFFTKSIVWLEWFATKEDINFKIMSILKEEGVSVAFPTRSIYMEKPDDVRTEG
ncbi:mechanosensitive ion channel domain-containing protein [Alkalihalobacillus hemicellulosilyticus]|uniref:mechanosensitive ion channel domain-containing protein n=1 Tax=Halalkalibacter hemicellulosilyticus TaxID=127886 RepID=UPI000692490A